MRPPVAVHGGAVLTERQTKPLDILLVAMRSFLEAGKMKEAADIAKAAAPYVHPKAVRGRLLLTELSNMTDDELDALRERSAARAGSAPPGAAEV